MPPFFISQDQTLQNQISIEEKPIFDNLDVSIS
jgi:hypothetical protein